MLKRKPYLQILISHRQKNYTIFMTNMDEVNKQFNNDHESMQIIPSICIGCEHIYRMIESGYMCLLCERCKKRDEVSTNIGTDMGVMYYPQVDGITPTVINAGAKNE